MTSAVPHIAVVDDEAPVRTMLGRLLRLADYDVSAFGSGEEFLDSLGERIPSCVILDIHMPGLSGFDVKSRLRARRTDIPVIFITASDDASLDQLVHEANGVGLLRKPFTNDELLDALNVALKGKACDTS